jgi:hypothetical protein
MSGTDGSLTLALIARVPPDGVAAFQSYESRVLPLLSEHGGRLERRLRSGDGTVELHIVAFAAADQLERFRADPRRAEAAPLLAQSRASTELLLLDDVGPEPGGA